MLDALHKKYGASDADIPALRARGRPTLIERESLETVYGALYKNARASYRTKVRWYYLGTTIKLLRESANADERFAWLLQLTDPDRMIRSTIVVQLGQSVLKAKGLAAAITDDYHEARAVHLCRSAVQA